MWNPAKPWLLYMCVCLISAIGCSKSLSPVIQKDGASALADPSASDASREFFLRLHFVGTVVEPGPGFVPGRARTTDFFVFVDRSRPFTMTDTVPVNAVLKDIRWQRGQGSGQSDRSQFYDYALNRVLRSVGDGLPFAPGFHDLQFEIPARLGGGTIDVEILVGFPPDAVWWAGPDPAQFPPSSDGDGRAVDVLSWASFTTSPAWPPDGRAFFGPDSFQFTPVQRRPLGEDFTRRGTFYEIFGDRIYARAEGDTVHMGAWVAFVTGGFDRDSRYLPVVSATAPGLPPGFESRPDLYSLLIAQGLIGSPIGFRLSIPTRLPDGTRTFPSETTTYPNFDPASVLYQPIVAGYWKQTFPGKAYATAMAQDAEGFVRRAGEDLVALADRVDGGGGSAADLALRPRVLTFFVRESPGPTAAAALRPAGGTSGSHH